MAKKKQTANPYEMEMLDLWNEVGGQMVIEYHTAKIKPAKEVLQALRDNDIKTDVMNCIMAGLVAGGLNQKDATEFIEQAFEAGAAPSVTFEAAEGEALNITDKENNQMVAQLVEAIENQEQEREP